MTPIQEKVKRLNMLFIEIAEYKADHPDECIGYYEDNIGSLLNAYREGDLRWDAAIAAIRNACTPQRSDSQRLDFLINERIVILKYENSGYRIEYPDGKKIAGGTVYLQVREHRTARAAIDAAMQPVAAGEAKERGDNE